MIRIETGALVAVIVAVIVAIIGGAVYIGHLQGQINALDPSFIQRIKQEALTEMREQEKRTIAALEAKAKPASDAINAVAEELEKLRNDTGEELEKNRKETEGVKAVLEPLPPGTVIASVLEPKLFLSEGREEKWRLADASTIPPGSKYGTLVANASIASIDRLPDLRGVFLRGLNIGRTDGKEDPDGNNRKAGDYQGVATKRPNRAFTGVTVESGEHSHGFDGSRHHNSGAGDHARAKPKGQRRTTSPAGKHRHNVEITGGGDKETRPANASVYLYIKIN